MGRFDFSQLGYLIIALVGIVVIVEIVRITVVKTIPYDEKIERTERVEAITRIFSIVRYCVIGIFLGFMVFTLVFNRKPIHNQHQDMGYEKNVDKLDAVDEEKLQEVIKKREEKFQEKDIEDINAASEQSYDRFLEKAKEGGTDQ